MAAQPATTRAKTVDMTPREMRAAAKQAMQSGNGELTLAMANALLRRDPDDLPALLLKSRAARDLGQYKAAITSARRAWRLAKTAETRYDAALSLAQALSSNGQKTRAQSWLRRAAQSAPNTRLKNRAVRDFRYVRATNPWATQLRFSISPTSNINNGSKSDTMVIGGLAFDLSGDARALSGIEYRYGLTLTRRWRSSRYHGVRLGLRLDGRRYTLSAAAHRQAPSAKAADYGFQSAEAVLASTRVNQRGDIITAFQVAGGQNWFANTALARYGRLGISQRWKRDARTELRYSLDVERQLRLDDARRSASVLSAGAGWQRRANIGLIDASFGGRRTRSQAASVAHRALFATIRYKPRAQLAGVGMEWSLGVEARNYDRPAFGGQIRHDRRTSLGLTLFFNDAQYFGFAPTLSLSAARNRSTVSLYDSQNIGLVLGLKSVF